MVESSETFINVALRGMTVIFVVLGKQIAVVIVSSWRI